MWPQDRDLTTGCGSFEVAAHSAKRLPMPTFCPWCGREHQACLDVAMERLMAEDSEQSAPSRESRGSSIEVKEGRT